MFRELAADNSTAWGAITLITKKQQAENLKLKTFSMNSTETATSTGLFYSDFPTAFSYKFQFNMAFY